MNSMEETNELKERLENTLITRTFHISGMPEATWNELDLFCKQTYGDVRWVMLKDMKQALQADWKFEMLHEEIEELKAKLASQGEKKGVLPNQRPTVKTFGETEMEKAVYIGDEIER